MNAPRNAEFLVGYKENQEKDPLSKNVFTSYKESSSVNKPRLLLFLLSADTFASKVAAIQDEYADNSVGNVTGSNAVNVFLGIGIAWSMAAIYWAAKGETFDVKVGRLVPIFML